MTFRFVSGDTGSKLRVTCRNDSDNSVIDLTGATVALRWYNRATDAVIERTMSIINPATGGQAEYQFAAAELVAPEMDFEVRITDSGGKIVRSLDLLAEGVRQAYP
jgi:hypothetical protein